MADPIKLLRFPMYSLYYIDDTSSDDAVEKPNLDFVLGAMREQPKGKERIVEAIELALADKDFDFTDVLSGLPHSNDAIRNWLDRLRKRLARE